MVWVRCKGSVIGKAAPHDPARTSKDTSCTVIQHQVNRCLNLSVRKFRKPNFAQVLLQKAHSEKEQPYEDGPKSGEEPSQLSKCVRPLYRKSEINPRYTSQMTANAGRRVAVS